MERLKELRQKEGLSQKELGGILNVSQNTVSQWENGTREPDFGTLTLLANRFGVSIDYLIGRTEDINFDGGSADSHDNQLQSQNLGPAYFRIAKQAESDNIAPEDIQKAIDLIKDLRGKKRG